MGSHSSYACGWGITVAFGWHRYLLQNVHCGRYNQAMLDWQIRSFYWCYTVCSLCKASTKCSPSSLEQVATYMIDEGLIHYLFLASDIQTDATSRNQSTGNFARQTLHIQHVNTSHKGSENCFSTLQMAFSLVYKAHKEVFPHKTLPAPSNRLHTSTAYPTQQCYQQSYTLPTLFPNTHLLSSHPCVFARSPLTSPQR